MPQENLTDNKPCSTRPTRRIRPARSATASGWLLSWLLLAAGVPLPSVAQGPAEGIPETVVAELLSVGSDVSVGATVVPAREITFTAQMPGRVEYLAGAEGAFFKRSTVLVAMDDKELLAQRRAAIAQIGNAQAAQRNAAIQYQRELEDPAKKGMFGQMMPGPFGDMMSESKKGIERRADLFSQRTAMDQAQSALMAAQSKVQQIDVKLRDTRSYAPFDGVIVDKLVEVGDTVQPGQPLVNFADLSRLQLQADVPARLAVSLAPGMTVGARLDDVGETRIDARLVQVFPMADPTRHTVRVKFDIPQDAPAAPGMYAELLVPEPGGIGMDLPVIPTAAVFQRGGLPMVKVLNPMGRTELRLVRLGEQMGEDRVSVLAGVSPGDRVILKPRR